jgi:hypothetical protein
LNRFLLRPAACTKTGYPEVETPEKTEEVAIKAEKLYSKIKRLKWVNPNIYTTLQKEKMNFLMNWTN